MLNTKHLLEQLLQSGNALLKSQSSPQSYKSTSPHQHHEQHQHGGILQQVSAMLSGKGGAALGGGALGLLLGSKSGRKMGGKVLTYGGLAALGVLAYQALKNYQQQSQSTNTAPATPLPTQQPFTQLPPQQQEQHCHVILTALIAAAKADGHIDARERHLIDAEIAKMTADRNVQQWVERELQKPLDPADVAALATDQNLAAEIFLASVLVVDEENFMEKAYLQELARLMQLDLTLQTELRRQVQQAIIASQ